MLNFDHILITPDLLKLIAEIDEFKGSWKTLHHLAPERLAALKKIATIESVGSSTRIEGSKLSDRDVEELLSRINTYSFRNRDEEEVAGYAEVMEQIFFAHSTIPLTENYIKQLHAMLLKFSSKDSRHRGQYKTISNNVEAFDETGKSLGIIFATSSLFDTPFEMQSLTEWTQQTIVDKSLHPLLTIGIFIVSFLAIHPFQDGNGRLSRVLTTLLLLNAGYTYVPYSSLENVIEEHKESYYLALRRTQATLKDPQPNWEPWLKFFLQTLKIQKDRLEKKLSREQLLMASLPTLSLKIIELTKEQGRITISELEQFTQANRNTIKSHLRQLVLEHKLVQCGKGRSTWYILA